MPCISSAMSCSDNPWMFPIAFSLPGAHTATARHNRQTCTRPVIPSAVDGDLAIVANGGSGREITAKVGG